MTKRTTKSLYISGIIGLNDALASLMFDHGMDRGDALKYLGL